MEIGIRSKRQYSKTDFEAGFRRGIVMACEVAVVLEVLNLALFLIRLW